MQYFKSLFSFHKLALTTIIALGSFTSLPLAANHSEHRFDTDSRLSGNSLEHDLWNLVQSKDHDKLADLISPMFLGGNLQGMRNYDSELSILKNLSITGFTITNVFESQDEDIRIISYDFTATGDLPINDHRISIWQRKKHKHHQFFWQLISQSTYSENP
ncbi:MAG: hypothetical protein H0X29_02550 [Parachlamydiaceae bacterium]|nr:hypothetical protein [Parachlamydiaceae bacterium]